MLFVRTMQGNNWPHGLRFKDRNLTQLGCDQQSTRAALSQHAAVFLSSFQSTLCQGALRLDRDRRGEEQPQ